MSGGGGGGNQVAEEATLFDQGGEAGRPPVEKGREGEGEGMGGGTLDPGKHVANGIRGSREGGGAEVGRAMGLWAKSRCRSEGEADGRVGATDKRVDGEGRAEGEKRGGAVDSVQPCLDETPGICVTR